MNPLSPSRIQSIIFRLTALWALNESGLGGFLHATNFPFAGLIVGSITIALISFIIYFSDKDKGILLNSLLLVMIIKLLLSPHAGLTAYFAVFFQVLCAYTFYRLLGIHLLSIIIVCILSFLETAFQQLLTLTLIGGLSFWNAIDVFIEKIGIQFLHIRFNDASLWIISIYFSIYVIFALLTAFFIHSLFSQIRDSHFILRSSESIREYLNVPDLAQPSRKPRWIKYLLYATIILFVVFTFLYFNKDSFKDNFLVYYFLRTISVLLFWYYMLMPGVMKWIKKYLNKKMPAYQAKVDEIIEVFPKFKLIIYYAWSQSAAFKGFKRLRFFFTLTLLEIISYK